MDIPTDLAAIVDEFDHLSIAVWKIDEAVAMVRSLGATYDSGAADPEKGYTWMSFHLPGSTMLELIEPLDPDDRDHFLVRYLERRGEGVHHVTFRVSDLSAAVSAARVAGYDVVGVDDNPPWREAFLHPRSAHGVLVQLAQPDGDLPAFSLDEVLRARALIRERAR